MSVQDIAREHRALVSEWGGIRRDKESILKREEDIKAKIRAVEKRLRAAKDIEFYQSSLPEPSVSVSRRV